MKSILKATERIRPLQESYPVETVAIAKDIGLKVWRANNWSDEVSGKIQKCEGKMKNFAGHAGICDFR